MEPGWKQSIFSRVGFFGVFWSCLSVFFLGGGGGGGTFGGVFRTDWKKIHVELAGKDREGFILKGRIMAREGCF
jgi:hypothetical protein